MTLPLLHTLVAAQVGDDRARSLLAGTFVHPSLLEPDLADEGALRAVIAHALGIVLLDDFLGRVPAAAVYAEARWADGDRIHLDHFAVRTVAGVDCGELAPGQESVARILRPLGYTRQDDQALTDQRTTRRSWCHLDLPRDLAQFVVSELHADRFGDDFRTAAARVVRSSTDPLTGLAAVNLERLTADHRLPRHRAESLVGELASCFQRHHGPPALADYELLSDESDLMAWITSEGTALVHLAVRVADAHAMVEDERRNGRPIGRGGEVSVSPSGRVRRVAYPPTPVERSFRTGEHRATETRMVPGPHLELVTRLPLVDGPAVDYPAVRRTTGS